MPVHPLRKYFPFMHGASIDEEDIAPDSIAAGDIADGAIGTGELADDALSADAAGRLKIATDYFDVATLLDKIAAGAFTVANVLALFATDSFTEANVLDLFAAGSLTEANLDALIADNQFTLSLMNNLMVAGALADDRLASFLVKNPGVIAHGLVDFNAVSDAANTVTIGAVTYLEADAPTVTNGEWTNGASATDSATSLAAGINGDTRNAGGPSYAAIQVGTSVWLFALAIGTAGNVAVSHDTGADPDVEESLIDGAAAAVKQTVQIQHAVTAEEAVQVQVLIPLPFDAAFFEWHVYDATGGILATEVTDRGTVVAGASPIPAYFQVLTNGATHISSGDIIRLTARE